MKITKRILSFLMAVIMLFTGMAVTAFASTPLYTLNESNCYVDLATIEIFVKAATVEYEGEEYDVDFSAHLKNDPTKTLRVLKDGEGNTILDDPTTGKTYTVTGTITVGEDTIKATNDFDVEVLKAQNTPAAPVPKKVTSTVIEIANVSGCEYKLNDGAWASKTTFTDLTPDTYYTIYIRAKKTATHYASDAASVIVKTLKEAGTAVPSQPVFVDKTNTSITVQEVAGVEFSINNGASWQSSGVFTGLKADTTYAIIARYTFDKSVQEPNPACAPKEIRTNTRASYPADIKNCTFKADEGKNYANQSIAIAVTADTPAKYHDTEYGDTKYIPAYYTVGSSSNELEFSSSDGKVFKSDFVPGEANANKKLAVNVFFRKMKCVGEDENGDAKWIVVGEIESKTYYVQVGEVYGPFTEIRDFFVQIFNVLFNTIPAKINELIKDIDLGAITKGLGELLGGIGDLSGMLGGLK